MKRDRMPQGMVIRDRLLWRRSIDASGCWLWMGHRTPRGYGILMVRGGSRRVHRVAYTTFVGPIPAGCEVCHRCNVPACFNPEHLYVALHHQNMLDAARDGLILKRKGEKHPNALFTDAQALEVKWCARHGVNHRELALAYAVDRSTISAINRGVNWPHVGRVL